MFPIDKLPPIDSDSGDLNIIVESPHGSRNKFKWDTSRGIFMLDRILPDGMAFPFDFGFVPATLADDGDPIDAILIVDTPASLGVLIPARPIGIIEAEQTEAGVTVRNDRLVAVATASRTYNALTSLEKINPSLLYEFEQFFVNYHRLLGNEFRLLGHKGPAMVPDLILNGIEKLSAGRPRAKTRASAGAAAATSEGRRTPAPFASRRPEKRLK
jgi:inorganic pyrophosphatase